MKSGGATRATWFSCPTPPTAANYCIVPLVYRLNRCCLPSGQGLTAPVSGRMPDRRRNWQSDWSRRASLPVCLCYGSEGSASPNQEFPVAVSCPCLDALSDLLTSVSIPADASRRSTGESRRVEASVPVNPGQEAAGSAPRQGGENDGVSSANSGIVRELALLMDL